MSVRVPHRVDPGSHRKYWLVAILNLVGFYSMIQPLLGVTPECSDKHELGFAIQTSQVSCSPTSAVNLLAHYSISTDESEMAQLCLTRLSKSFLGWPLYEGGTSWLGLYRGFKLKLRGQRYEPRFFHWNFQQFRNATPENPLIISLSLDPKLKYSQPEKYEDLCQEGWQPGTEHNVVFSKFIDGRVAIIDPKVGYEEMDLEKFRILWVGRGIYLEEIQ